MHYATVVNINILYLRVGRFFSNRKSYCNVECAQIIYEALKYTAFIFYLSIFGERIFRTFDFFEKRNLQKGPKRLL